MSVKGGFGSERATKGCARKSIRLGPFVGVALLGVAPLLSCGGRSEVLEVANDSGGASGSVVAGSSSVGGSSSSGKGPIDKGASGGSAGKRDKADVESACRSYCKGFSLTCAERVAAEQCDTGCIEELETNGNHCQKLGLRAVGCIEPFYAQGRLECEYAIRTSTSACAADIDAFNACKDRSAAPGAPTPERPPPPARPPPSPVPESPQCFGEVVNAPTHCTGYWQCGVPEYFVNCTNVMGSARCSCSKDGQLQQSFVLDQWNDLACANARLFCGFQVDPY